MSHEDQRAGPSFLGANLLCHNVGKARCFEPVGPFLDAQERHVDVEEGPQSWLAGFSL